MASQLPAGGAIQGPRTLLVLAGQQVPLGSRHVYAGLHFGDLLLPGGQLTADLQAGNTNSL